MGNFAPELNSLISHSTAHYNAVFASFKNALRPSFNSSSTPTPTQQVPYMFGPYEIPGRLEAENFDCGNAYYDTTEPNEGKAFRTTPVDIEITGDSEGGHNIGWTRTGEWLKYKLNVKQTGVYNITSRFASTLATSKFILRVDGQNVTPVLSVPSTGAWQRYTNVATAGISLSAGIRTLEVYIIETVGNYNYLDFKIQSNAQPSVSSIPIPSPTTSHYNITTHSNY